MKSMRSFVRLGANHSHRRRYGADLQRRMAHEGAISCNRFGGTDYQVSRVNPDSPAVSRLALGQRHAARLSAGWQRSGAEHRFGSVSVKLP